MTPDPRLEQARKAADDARASEEKAQDYRARRNELIIELRTEDPDRWTYQVLADALGVSIELIAKIVQRRT